MHGCCSRTNNIVTNTLGRRLELDSGIHMPLASLLQEYASVMRGVVGVVASEPWTDARHSRVGRATENTEGTKLRGSGFQWAVSVSSRSTSSWREFFEQLTSRLAPYFVVSLCASVACLFRCGRVDADTDATQRGAFAFAIVQALAHTHTHTQTDIVPRGRYARSVAHLFTCACLSLSVRIFGRIQLGCVSKRAAPHEPPYIR